MNQDGRHWHVTVTVSGDPVEPLLMRSALLRFSEERPFLESMRFTGSGAEIKFWDEGESMIDVASLALRMWNEHRDSSRLPRWEVVGSRSGRALDPPQPRRGPRGAHRLAEPACRSPSEPELRPVRVRSLASLIP